MQTNTGSASSCQGRRWFVASCESRNLFMQWKCKGAFRERQGCTSLPSDPKSPNFSLRCAAVVFSCFRCIPAHSIVKVKSIIFQRQSASQIVGPVGLPVPNLVSSLLPLGGQDRPPHHRLPLSLRMSSFVAPMTTGSDTFTSII